MHAPRISRHLLGIATLLAGTSFLFSPLAHAVGLDAAHYDTALAAAEHEFGADKARCEPMAGNANDICMARANGTHDVELARLAHARSGSAADAAKLEEVRAESTYAIASQLCDDAAGNVKDVCMEQAKAARDKSLAGVTLNNEVRAASREARQDTRDADYDVAIAKCDFLSGATKTQCVDAAKLKYAK